MFLTRELKMLWDMKVTLIPIVVGALQTVPKDLEKRLGKLRGSIKTIKASVVLKSVETLRRVLQT